MPDTGISVLVLYESFAVATVLLTRLLDMPMVHMVRAESVSACDGRYDVVVVDPYLRAHRRADDDDDDLARRHDLRPTMHTAQPSDNGPVVNSDGTDVESLRAALAEAEHARETAQRRMAELEEANEELNQFASIVSHDLREPL